MSATFTEQFPIKGRLKVTRFKGVAPEIANGKIKFDPTKTWVLSVDDDGNKVVDRGRQLVNEIMNGSAVADPITQLAIGSGGYVGTPNVDEDPDAPQANDSVLRTLIFKKTITSRRSDNICATTFICSFSDDEPAISCSISEFGLMTTGNLLFARRTTRPMAKENFVVHFIVEWTIQY